MVRDYQFRDILTRQQLAQFLKNPETIRAFENLTVDIGEILPANEAEITRIARLALALSAQALMIADREPEDQMVVPGQRGVDGQDGKIFVWFEDGEPGEQGPPGPQGPAGSGGGGGGSSVVTGEVVITVPAPGRIEHSQSVAAAAITPGMKVLLGVAPHTDADENGAEGLNIQALSGEAGAGTINVIAAFGELTSGPIRLNYIAAP
jgi:hypothetical protein